MKAKTSILTLSTAVVVTMISCIGISISNVSALTYQSSYENSFTINPSVSIELSSADLVINDLVPGNAADSNTITLNVSSNNAYGYTISSTVGNSTNYTNTNLKHQTSTVEDNFTSLATSDSISSLNNIEAGKWGYAFNVNNGTWSNYSGLPYAGNIGENNPAAELYSTSSNVNSTIDFKIAASAKSQQMAGEYNNVINFITTVTPGPVTFAKAYMDAGKTTYNGYYTMQDMSSSICSAVEEIPSELPLIDIRDNEVYLVGKLKDGRCWMKDNLRLGSNEATMTLTSVDSNISGSSYALPISTNDLTSWTIAQINTTYKNRKVTNYGSGSGKMGAYYNYCAATAGTYCYASGAGTGNADHDICPVNWRMPTGDANGEFQKLYDKYNTSTVATELASLQYNLSTPLSGMYDSTDYYIDGRGMFWGTTYYNENSMHRLLVTSQDVLTQDLTYRRNYGLPIRCIANN